MNKTIYKTFAALIVCALAWHPASSQNEASLSGFIVKFKDDVTYSRQQELLAPFPELILLEEKENALLPQVSLVKFFKAGYSTETLNSIKKNLEKKEEVIYVNPFSTVPGGHFSAPLGQFYVKINSAADYPALENLADETRTRIICEYHYMPNVFILEADKFSNGNSKEMAKFFSEKKIFRYASPNMMFSLDGCSPNDQLYNRQWAIENTGTQLQFYGTPDADMDVDSAWTISTGDSTIKIAVIDSGVDTAHADLAGNLLPGFDATGGGSGGFPNTSFPEDGHGTCCSGIIAAVANNTIGTAGVAYQCKVIPVKMFYYVNLNGTHLPFSTNQWGLDAINWTWQTANADVASNSWGIPDSLMATLGIDTAVSNDAINNAVTYGRNGKGLPMLFSAGNSPDTFCLWPARTPATIAVAATTMCDELKTMNDCSPDNFWASNHGTGLDISAPGVKIATSDFTGSEGFSGGNYNLAFGGTSAACPNAAGVMALILSVNKNLSAQQAREIISNSCEKTGGYAYNVNAPYGSWSMELGYGRVNAYRALQMALGMEEVQVSDDFIFFIYKDNEGKNYLNYHLTSASNVSIEIFDVLGRSIENIKDGLLISGSHRVEIGTSITKRGVYLVRIFVDDKSYSRKFLW